ncbi:8886_t:CDS:2, partial [Gigaspora rosea]
MGGSRSIPKISQLWSQNNQYSLSDGVFYLNLSLPFTVDSPPLTDISDISQMPFKNLSLPNNLSKRYQSTTTLMPDGKIIYIGGLSQSNPGDNVTRIFITEVTPNNYTIVILEETQSYGNGQTISCPVFILLNVKSEPFQYSAFTPSGSIPPPLVFCTATLYQGYMIVAFGNDLSESKGHMTKLYANYGVTP